MSTLHVIEASPIVTLEATEARAPGIERLVNEALDICPHCGDYGRMYRHLGQTIYCACRAGIAAELEDRDRVLSILAEKIEACPKFDTKRLAGLRFTFNRLRDEYDEIERTRWTPVYGVTE